MAASSTKLPVTKGKGGIGGAMDSDDDNHETTGGGKKPAAGRWGFVQFFFVLAVVLCVLLYAPRLLVLSPSYGYTIDVGLFAPSSSSSSPSSSVPVQQHVVVDGGGGGGTNAGDDHADGGGGHGREEEVPVPVPVVVLDNQVDSPCSSMRDHTICCDRSSVHTDVCFMSGDVRTDAASLSLLLYPPPHHHHFNATSPSSSSSEEETVRPYPRKWETFIMDKIPEVRLRRVPSPEHDRRCDVRHEAPLLVMSAGGYTGNLFHAFNDGFLPAWVTSQHLRGDVVLGVVSYNPWWAGTFREVISALSSSAHHHPVVDLLHDTRTHCFPGAVVGTRYHGILSVDPSKLRDHKTVVDFHHTLAHAYDADDENILQNPPAPETETKTPTTKRPRLGIVSRRGTRVIENQAAVAELAKSVGFDVEILETSTSAAPPTMSAWYAALRACDGVVGVHGADLTKFLFMRPSSSSWLTQIAPLGVSPIAREDFGIPAERMGLAYEQYEVRADESSLARVYKKEDVVLADPEKAKREQGWDLVARVYLGGQNVTLDLDRFRGTLVRMHKHALRQRLRRR